MPTALVTGATAGLGAEFARQLAAAGQDLVLVARDVDRLEQRAADLRTAYGVRVEVLGADLADRDQLDRVAQRLADPDQAVDTLVNNAGFARRTGFLADDLAEEERAVDVMLRAVLVLSHAAARAMKQRGRGAIVNVASVAAFVAMGTYSATKSWVVVFSEALSRELSGTGVSATAVCPGFVHTEFHQRASLNMSRLPEWGWIDAEQVVREGLAGAARGRPVVVPSRRYAALVTVLRYLPRGVVRAVSAALAARRRRESQVAQP
jgi:short-subunit dehydrogenase